jgi:hypothetical protein
MQLLRRSSSIGVRRRIPSIRPLSVHVGITEKYMALVNADSIKYDENQYKIIQVCVKAQHTLSCSHFSVFS